MSIERRKRNIRKLPTKELKSYKDAYKKEQVYKFAYIEAEREMKRRKKGIKLRPRRKHRQRYSLVNLPW